MNVKGFLQQWRKPKGESKEALAEGAQPSGRSTLVRGRRPPVTHDPNRDLAPPKHTQMRRICQYLYRANPIAKRGVKNLCSFVTSEGFAPRATCENDAHREYLQTWLDEWWKKNKWDRLLPKRYETLSVEGEWFFWRTAPNARGISRMCYLRPERISEVEIDELDAERFHKVKLSPSLEFETDGDREWRNELAVADEDNPDGEVLYFQLNALVGQTRGFSDLLVVADWLDQLDTVILTEVERVQYQRAFSWFVKLTGVEPGKLLETVERIQADGPPGPGGVLVHNETEEWDAKSPELHLADSVEFIKFIMHLCFGGLYMPEHFYATGGDVNKATSSNMDTPIFAVARDRKGDLNEFLRLAITLDLKQARAMGVFATYGMDDDQCFNFEIQSRDPDRAAYDLLGEVLTTFGTAMQLGQDEGWITSAEAAQAFRMAAQGMGLGDFPGIDLESLQKAAQSRLEANKDELSKQYPLKVARTREALAEAEGDSKKKELLEDLEAIVRDQTEATVTNASKARAFAERMTKEVSAELLAGGSRDGSISTVHVEEVLRRLSPRFQDGIPSAGMFGAVDSGREFVRRTLAGKGLEIPSGSAMTSISKTRQAERDLYWRVLNVTVAEPPEGVSRSVGGRRRSLGREAKYSLAYWAGQDFENAILERMRTAQSQGVSLAEFAKSLSDGKLAEITGRRVMANIAHAEVRAQKFAEELMYQDIDAANPGKIQMRFLKIGPKYCGICSPLSGDTFDVSDPEARSRYRTPKHRGCRCGWYPVVAGDDTTANFIQKLAAKVDEASEPVRAMYRTGPDLAAFVQEARAAGIETVDDVARVGGRALEDIRDELANVPGFKEKIRAFQFEELKFKTAEDVLKAAEFEHLKLRNFDVLRAAQVKFANSQLLWSEARREVAEVRGSAVVRVLKSGGVELGGEPFRWHSNTPKEVRKTFSTVARLIPRPWVESLQRAYMVGERAKDERDFGYYPKDENRPGKPGRMVIGGASSFLRSEAAFHELLHPIELANPHLLDLMKKFRKGRGFADPYFTRDYHNDGTEILSSGLESVYFSTRRTWSDDDGLLEFLIGAMLAL